MGKKSVSWRSIHAKTNSRHLSEFPEMTELTPAHDFVMV
jgi:hypothetical protein